MKTVFVLIGLLLCSRTIGPEIVPRAPLQVSKAAHQLTNRAENGDASFHFDYVENLGDGRGWTCGAFGFVTASDEVLSLVSRLNQKRPNALARFLPRLRVLARQGSARVCGLQGFARAWRLESQQRDFCALQRDFARERFENPALRRCREYRVFSALGVAALYDAMIEHGDDGDADSLGAMLRETARRCGKKGDQRRFITAFLRVRKRHLMRAADPHTRAVWRQSTGRVDVLLGLAKRGDWNLNLRPNY